MKKTRCVIKHGSPAEISAQALGRLLSNWATIAELLERRVTLSDDETLVWTLNSTGGIDEEWSFYAYVELCTVGYLSLASPSLAADVGDDVRFGKSKTLLVKSTVDGVGVLQDGYTLYGFRDQGAWTPNELVSNIKKKLLA